MPVLSPLVYASLRHEEAWMRTCARHEIGEDQDKHGLAEAVMWLQMFLPIVSWKTASKLKAN